MPKHSLYQSNADKRFPHRWLVRSDWLCYLSWLGAWWEPNEPITSFEPKTHKNWVLILLGIVAALPIQLRLLPPSLKEGFCCQMCSSGYGSRSYAHCNHELWQALYWNYRELGDKAIVVSANATLIPDWRALSSGCEVFFLSFWLSLVFSILDMPFFVLLNSVLTTIIFWVRFHIFPERLKNFS